jgi:hypothetical protein
VRIRKAPARVIRLDFRDEFELRARLDDFRFTSPTDIAHDDGFRRQTNCT